MSRRYVNDGEYRTKIQYGVQGFGSNQKNELYYNGSK